MIKTMTEKTTLNLKDSYKNPFADYNANVMDTKTILGFWCSPFNFMKSTDVKESDIYTEKMPIVFMGGRGTGKTMFLRYWSYPVQIQQTLNNTDTSGTLLPKLKEKGGIGFYIRIDGLILRSFEGHGVCKENWSSVFEHYFELVIGRAYIEFIRDLINYDSLDVININKKFVPAIASILGSPKKKTKNIADILADIDNKIKEVTNFRSEIAYSDTEFLPSKAFKSQSLSFEIPMIAKENINEFEKDINFIILIDEYENFLEPQQRMVNTLLKFVKQQVTFRIGMRLEGFRTFDTISRDDFIKEGRDYQKVVFEDVLIKNTGYQSFLKNVAKKRLERVNIFKENGFTDISTILGKAENLEKEAVELVKNNPGKHFGLLKTHSPKEIELLKNAENPLMEMLNILWVSRGVDVKTVNKAMNDYLQKKQSVESKKYKDNYVNKYKLSLMFLLASIYRKNKKYYSFNTFSFLSSGIVGHFIELCRKSFQYAEFEDRELLFQQGRIQLIQQDKAARDIAAMELEMIQRIEDFGDNLYYFILNLGNTFRDYHKDKSIKYPETNQFAVDKNLIEEPFRNAFNAALKWSVIQKKPALQQPTPGKHVKDLYTLNRIFSPRFEISYRTRGGFSVELNQAQIKERMTKKVKLETKQPKRQNITPQQKHFSF